LQNVVAIEPSLYRDHLDQNETASTGEREDGVDEGEVGPTKREI
jgi:hypothetical protein